MAERDSLDYLYGLQTFGIKLGLNNIRTLHDRLGSPADGYRTVLVAGTNGKGSTASALAEILRQAGVRTGLYTSPHLHSFTERIRIDGVPVGFADLEPLIDDIRRLGSDLPLTFFEFTTALALETFRRNRVEVAVLEVGMGGRLDATNIVTPALGIITPIAYDHQTHLGNTLTQIAGEKAGIMRKGVPVVLAGQEPESEGALLAAARELGAEPVIAGTDFSFSVDGQRMRYHGLDSQLADLLPALLGAHQQANMAVALAAAELLRRQGLPLEDAHLAAGIASVAWPGRLEWFGANRRILLDGAHNGSGAEALANYLASHGHQRVRWVVGMKRDKVATQILQPLLHMTVAVYCVEPPIEDALPVSELARAVSAEGGSASVCLTLGDALGQARSDCVGDEIVLVAGSLFLVAAARELLERERLAVAS